MSKVKFLQSCEDSSELSAGEVTDQFLSLVGSVTPITVGKKVAGFKCVTKFKEGQIVKNMPETLTEKLLKLNLIEVLD